MFGWRPWRFWCAGLLAVLLVSVATHSVFGADAPSTAPTTAPTTAPAAAADPVPDPTGAYQLTPTALSVPNYVSPPAKPDEKASAADKAKYDADLKAWYATNGATNLDAVAQSASRSYFSINFVWTLVAGFLVMFMQAGFALVEAGLCRAKNAGHTMAMNFMVYALGMTGFFICGFAFMCGGANGTPIGGPGMLGGIPVLNTMFRIGDSAPGVADGWGLFGMKGFFLYNTYDASAIVWFLFMMVFMDTTATIPTGAAAERWNFKSFFIFSLFIGGFIYPIYGGWVWGGGWLAQLGLKAGLAHGAVDYAGSGVVHLQGGSLALILAILIGPRLGKYDKNGKIVGPIAPHHMPMVFLGTFILAFGWFGFNAGSSLAGTDGRIGIIAVNTMLASASGALASCLYMWWFGPTKKPDPAMMCNGMLAGLVAITAPCAFVVPWAAFLIGGIAGVLVVWSVFFFDKIGVDDCVGAISVHGVNGAWGLLALGLFADGTYGGGWNGIGATDYLGKAGQGVTGLFYGDSKQFIAQVIDVVVCVGWNVVVGGLIFFIIGKVVGGNRVSAETEIAGLDMPEMGALGYPDFALTGASGPEATSVQAMR